MKPWMLSVHRYPTVDVRSAEWHEEARVLQSVGYHGSKHYATPEEAANEANRLLSVLDDLNPDIQWMAVWCNPFTERRNEVSGVGQCYWKSSHSSIRQ